MEKFINKKYILTAVTSWILSLGLSISIMNYFDKMDKQKYENMDLYYELLYKIDDKSQNIYNLKNQIENSELDEDQKNYLIKKLTK